MSEHKNTSKYRSKHSNSKSRSSTSKSTKSRYKTTKKHFTVKTKLIAVLVLAAALSVIYGGTQLSAYMSSATDIRLTDEGYKHNDRFSDYIIANGIDVSVHQGDIDWPKVKTSGTDFVFVRAGYRSADDGTLHTDANFDINMKGASKAGIMTGVYFYSQALTSEEAEEEADYLLNLVEDYDVDLPLVIDFEIYHGGRLEEKIKAGELYASSMYHNIVLAFCRRVEKAGYESMVYANSDMLTNYMDYTLLQQEADIWLASYDTFTSSEADYSFWQCSDSATVGGISGSVDHNFWYIDPAKVYSTRAAGSSDNRTSIGDCEVVFDQDSYSLWMRQAKPSFEVTINGDELREGRDYVYSVIENTEIGTGYVILRGIGEYKYWRSVPFTIE